MMKLPPQSFSLDSLLESFTSIIANEILTVSAETYMFDAARKGELVVGYDWTMLRAGKSNSLNGRHNSRELLSAIYRT